MKKCYFFGIPNSVTGIIIFSSLKWITLKVLICIWWILPPHGPLRLAILRSILQDPHVWPRRVERAGQNYHPQPFIISTRYSHSCPSTFHTDKILKPHLAIPKIFKLKYCTCGFQGNIIPKSLFNMRYNCVYYCTWLYIKGCSLMWWINYSLIWHPWLEDNTLIITSDVIMKITLTMRAHLAVWLWLWEHLQDELGGFIIFPASLPLCLPAIRRRDGMQHNPIEPESTQCMAAWFSNVSSKQTDRQWRRCGRAARVIEDACWNVMT